MCLGTNSSSVAVRANLTLYIKFYNSIVEAEYASPSSYDYLIDSILPGIPIRALYVLGDESGTRKMISR